MNLEERRAIVLWGAIEGIGSQSLLNLRKWSKLHSTSMSELWKSSKLVFSSLIPEKSRVHWQKMRSQFTPDTYDEWLKTQGISYVIAGDNEYPHLLRQCNKYPEIIYYRGNQALLNARLPIAVVGTRQITSYGKRATKQIVADLVNSRATIVSGFMYGVDLCAHQAALNSGGKTVAVLGFGLCTMYPTSHQKIMINFLQEGALFLSPFAPTVRAFPGNFPARNNIVAGLSKAILVVEAASKSGSLLTAQAGLDEGRLVGAVTGPFDSLYVEGVKSLINQGAILVSSARDLLVELEENYTLTTYGGSSIDLENYFNDKKELYLIYKVIVQLNPTFDELLLELKIDYSQLSTYLTSMEISGLIEKVGQRWTSVSLSKSELVYSITKHEYQ